MKPLPPFNPKATCPKCGSEQISRSWREGSKAEKLPEHLERICMECGVTWKEACLDHTPKNGKKPAVQTSAEKRKGKKKPAAQPA